MHFGTLLELDFSRMCTVCILMYHQSYLLHEWLITHTPQINGCCHLCVHWCTFITLNGERPFTCGLNLIHFTGKWTPSTTCELIVLQVNLLHEWYVTHTTGTWMLSTLCMLIYPQMTWLCEWFITHITGMCFLPLCRLLCCLYVLLHT